MTERIHEDQPVQTSGLDLEEADKAVIMLHGRGGSAAGMIQLSEKLPDAAYFAPQASQRTWYPQSFLEPRNKNQPHLDSALKTVDSLVEKAADQVGKEKVFLLGFSQGACLASEYMVLNPDRYGGLIALSGGLIGDELPEYSGDLQETPVFIGCSDNDPHIPLERVNVTEEVCQKLNCEVERYLMEGSHHGIVDYEIEQASEIIGLE